MAWTINYTATAEKHLQRLDRSLQQRIVEFLHKRVGAGNDPRSTGKTLKGKFTNYWRYRVGDYRIICEIQDDRLTMLVISVGHRREGYR